MHERRKERRHRLRSAKDDNDNDHDHDHDDVACEKQNREPGAWEVSEGEGNDYDDPSTKKCEEKSTKERNKEILTIVWITRDVGDANTLIGW